MPGPGTAPDDHCQPWQAASDAPTLPYGVDSSTYLERVERLNPTLGAYITVMSETARAEAASAEDEIGQGLYRGPLHGIPVAIKDIIYTQERSDQRRVASISRSRSRLRLHDRRTSASFRGRAAGQAEPERVRDRRHD